MPRFLKYALLLGIFLLLASIPLAMQFETGSIEGIIENDHGPIANASVEVRNIMSGSMVRVDADTEGHYIVENLRPGRYSLWVEAPGHDCKWIPQIVIERGEKVHKNIVLDEPRSTTTDL